MTGCSPVKLPVDLDPVAVHASVPSAAFTAQRLKIRVSSLPQTLPREKADFDLRLIEPTSMGWRVVDSETIPNLAAEIRAVKVG